MRSSLQALLVSTVLLMGLGGCAQMWDDLTAHSPAGGFGNDMSYRMNLLMFHRQDPIKVLAESQDGDLRRRAYLALKYSGDAEQKELVVKLLVDGAKSDKDLICRLAAVEKLGEMPDPRCSQALVDAFYAPANVGESTPVVRVAAVRSLGKRRDPQSIQMLGEVIAKDPAVEVRIAAARALGGYKEPQATQPLMQALRDERDLAVRYETSAALAKLTGREPPANAADWEQHLQNPTRGSGVKQAAWWPW